MEVELKPSDKPGARPGDADKPDDRPLDDAGAMSSSSSAAPGQVNSSAPPEMNFVPSGRRDIVREYFQGPGDARSRTIVDEQPPPPCAGEGSSIPAQNPEPRTQCRSIGWQLNEEGR